MVIYICKQLSFSNLGESYVRLIVKLSFLESLRRTESDSERVIEDSLGLGVAKLRRGAQCTY